jgi:RND family efflux transporter MFP subunit
VTVSNPLKKKIVEWDEYTGRFAAVESVEVRARVSGYILSVHFTEGAVVEKGDLLFVIDPRPYQAALEQAKGELIRSEARDKIAMLKLGRKRTLLKQGAISQEDYDERVAEAREAEGQLQAAKGAVRSAKLNMEFTEVRSPIKGKIGRIEVTVGNLITGATKDATLLTTIVSLDPIYLYFDVDERTFIKYLKSAQGRNRSSLQEARDPVLAELTTERGFKRKGRVDFVDTRIDRQTATMRIRAVFPNPDATLLPGMFARVRFPGTDPYTAILIPGEAVGRDQALEFVYVVNKDNVVDHRNVELGPNACGLRIVRKGLNGDEKVVINGIRKARPGHKVEPVSGRITLDAHHCLDGQLEEVSSRSLTIGMEDSTTRKD